MLGNFSWSEFGILFAAGLLGLMISTPSMVAVLKTFIPTSVWQGNALEQVTSSLLRQSVKLALAVGLGLPLAHEIGMHLPLLESFLASSPDGFNIWATLLPGLILGIILGILGLFFLPPSPLSHWQTLSATLREGITEELFQRFFLLSLLTWILTKGWHTTDNLPTIIDLWVANLCVAIPFAILSLFDWTDFRAIIRKKNSPFLVIKILVFESAAGGVFGYLFWQNGLEAALLAHVICSLIPKLRKPDELRLSSGVTLGKALSADQALEVFIQAPIEELRIVLEREASVLLTKSTEKLFDHLIRDTEKRSNKQLTNRLNLRRMLLAEARKKGISQAWTHFQTRQRQVMEAAQRAEIERNALWEQCALRPGNVVKVRDIKASAETQENPAWQIYPAQTRKVPLFFPTTLRSWLLLTSYREQRSFLEAHLELLCYESTQHLEHMLEQAQTHVNDLTQISGGTAAVEEAIQDLQAHLELLDDIRARGGTIETIREAYINAHGGFTLDIPTWLLEVLAKLEQHSAPQTAQSRAAILREALIRAQKDAAVEPEVLAELQNELVNTLRINSEPWQAQSLEEIREAQKATLQVFTRERYPRQWVRTCSLIEGNQFQTRNWQDREAQELVADVDELVKQGKEFSRKNDLRQGVACFERAAKHERENVEVWSNLGALYARQGRFAKALLAFEHTLTLQPDNARVLMGKASVLESLKRDDEALTIYTSALAIESSDPLLWHSKGSLLDKMEQYENAVQMYNQALALNPELLPTWVNKGHSFVRLGRYEEALAAYECALHITEQHAAPWSGKGTILLLLNRYEEALTALDQALALDAEDGGTWENKASVLKILKRDSQANDAGRRARELDPTFPGYSW